MFETPLGNLVAVALIGVIPLVLAIVVIVLLVRRNPP
jgi:hypothetical protein